MSKIILFDLNNIAFSLINRRKLNKEGLTRYTEAIAKKFDCEKIIVAMDGKRGQYWRNDVFPDYKMHRPVRNTELRDKLLKVCDEYPVVLRDKLEADDLIAHAARSGRYDEVIGVSEDSDFAQLGIFKCFRQYQPRKDKFIQYTPKQALYSLLDKTLRGDRKDNILKSHYQRQIRKAQFISVLDEIYDDLVQCMVEEELSVRNAPIRQIALKHLYLNFYLDISLFHRNFTLLNLIQKEF